MKNCCLNLLDRELTEMEFAPSDINILGSMSPGLIPAMVVGRCEKMLDEVTAKIDLHEITTLTIYSKMTPCSLAAIAYLEAALPTRTQIYLQNDAGGYVFLDLWTFAVEGMDYWRRKNDRFYPAIKGDTNVEK